MAGRYLQTHFTPEVLAAQEHYYGRAQPIPPQPQNIQNSTEVIAHYLYTKAFTGDANPQFGYASAIGVALFFLTLTLAVLMFRASSREKVEY